MARLYVFADEAGDFAFKRGPNVSKYFVVCTITTHSCAIAEDLLELRRNIAWNRGSLGEYFHATTDTQATRDLVFDVIRRHDFQIQATIMEKSKAQPNVTISKDRFYKYGWYYHFKHGLAKNIKSHEEVLITAASIGTKKGQTVFTDAVNDVVGQFMRRKQWATGFWPCGTDPCLQVADYCTWAIQRKWERNDSRSYDLIKDRIIYEYDLWSRGKAHYF